MPHVASEERRRFSRISFRRPAELAFGSARVACTVVDVSLKGALVEVPRGASVEDGAPCALDIQLDAGEVLIHMDGVIAHREGDVAGVRCDEIDLDSISHLRRLVELNLGDEELLHRELAALVRPRPA